MHFITPTVCRSALICAAFVTAFVFILVSSGSSSSRLAYHWVRLKPSNYWQKLKGLQFVHRSQHSNDSPSNDTGIGLHKSSYEAPSVRGEDFNIGGADVIVLVQIQNAGANFLERRLIEDLVLQRPCTCRRRRKICHCYRPRKRSSWLFSRYTLGWKCGVHPDWTELNTCVDRVLDEDEGSPTKRRYFYITVLRDPVARFRSEWRRFHQNRGWHGSRPHPHFCLDQPVSMPAPNVCFEGRRPENITFSEFVSCSANPAINRQTHMLADHDLIDGCPQNDSAGLLLTKEDRDIVLLASAKKNLEHMAFFGLAEFPRLSESLFEATFKLKFRRRARPRKFLRGRSMGHSRAVPSPGEVEQVTAANSLDVELYNHAKEILFARFHKLSNTDPAVERESNSVDAEDDENWAEEEDFFDNL
ncbi:heparan-sulfate 6-O-sulfotransferase 2-like [Amblyomma americanum]